MELNIPERLILANMLPEQGSFTTLKMIDELKKALYPSEKEVKKYNIEQEEGTIRWNEKGAERLNIELTDAQIEFLKKELEKLGDSEKATSAHYAIYKRLGE